MRSIHQVHCTTPASPELTPAPPPLFISSRPWGLLSPTASGSATLPSSGTTGQSTRQGSRLPPPTPTPIPTSPPQSSPAAAAPTARPRSWGMRAFYACQMGFYLHGLLDLAVSGRRRDDRASLLLHHGSSLSLLLISFSFKCAPRRRRPLPGVSHCRHLSLCRRRHRRRSAS